MGLGPCLLACLLATCWVVSLCAGGSSGAVYRGTYMGTDVAIKTLSTNPDMMEQATAMLAAETKAIGNINHPNIVELIGILLDPPLTCVVLEVRNGGVTGRVSALPPRPCCACATHGCAAPRALILAPVALWGAVSRRFLSSCRAAISPTCCKTRRW